MREPKGRAEKGSQKWLQVLVNEHPEVINQRIRDELGLGDGAKIEWKSPLACDEYAEYRDQAAMDLLGARLAKVPLNDFWPRSGPRWDGLATTNEGHLILVEAKAHIEELVSTPTRASGKSLEKIRRSLGAAKKVYGQKSKYDWATCFYQYANRLAHLYLLRDLNKLPAHLLMLCFLNDAEMGGPTSEKEWVGALRLVDAALGVRHHKLDDALVHVFVDVQKLGAPGKV